MGAGRSWTFVVVLVVACLVALVLNHRNDKAGMLASHGRRRSLDTPAPVFTSTPLGGGRAGIWQLDVPTDIRQPDPVMMERFGGATVAPTHRPGRFARPTTSTGSPTLAPIDPFGAIDPSDVGDILPWSDELDADVFGNPTAPSLYGAASIPPLFASPDHFSSNGETGPPLAMPVELIDFGTLSPQPSRWNG